MVGLQRSTLQEYNKNPFLIGIINHKLWEKYVRIQQNVERKKSHQELIINPKILTELIFVLQYYQNVISKTISIANKLSYSKERQKVVLERYLNVISLKDLTLQFDCPEKILEQILMNKGIEKVTVTVRRVGKEQ